MRIASETIFRQALDAIQRNQTELARRQEQLATGERLARAGEDPAAFSASQRMDSRLSALDAFDRSGNRVMHRLSLAEDQLVETADILQRVRELTVQGGNAAQSAEDRAILRTELEQLRVRMLATANAGDGEGNALFAGTAPPPAYLAAPDGSVSYVGDGQRRFVSIDDQQRVADVDSGPSVFGRAPDDVFAAIDAALLALDQPDSALRSAATAQAIDALDRRLEDVAIGRARIGTRLQAVERSSEMREGERLQLQTARSALRDTDFAEAVTALTMADARLTASQQAYLKVQRASLFDLLR